MNSRFRTEVDVMNDLARLCRLDRVFEFRGQKHGGQGGRGDCRGGERLTVVRELSSLSRGGRERLYDLEERGWVSGIWSGRKRRTYPLLHPSTSDGNRCDVFSLSTSRNHYE